MAIYLDNSATTRVRPEVVEAMMPFLSEKWGNPSSIHLQGRKSKHAIDNARQQVAKLLNCDPGEVYFSSCGTLSNNVALLGRARFAEANGQGRHLITTAIEHPSVSGPVRYLESQGWKVTYLPLSGDGTVSPEQLEKSINTGTSIISVMWANNEIGTVEPIEALAKIAAKHEVFFHTDAVQAAGKVSIDLKTAPVCALSLSGHKFFAPKGIGVLFVRKLQNLMPIIFGGGQEMGLLPGTEALINIVALGQAAELAHTELLETQKHLGKLQKILADGLLSVGGVKLTGPAQLERRLPGHVSVVVNGAEGEAMVMRADLKGLYISSGSACHQGIIEPSQVLRAIGLGDKEALGSLRVSAGLFNTEAECVEAVSWLKEIIQSIKTTSACA